ncbi:hypothetical protein E1B28_013616 [Marasmius oreades]|uniref:Major facilitator superfamily (MFS) profile domain-containing protein n=1 Tax=Marasmius oreades TaxID=181124 RepID=A0A9P7RQS4_9AGAR|nr:uncharacterized protein E1B28_013616 [Marasmius oreades]KAG7087668.1 hypothetical protein E1B28_013616 [Marasmius oreades]
MSSPPVPSTTANGTTQSSTPNDSSSIRKGPSVNAVSGNDVEGQDRIRIEGELTRTSLERSLVFRLDCFLMAFGCISQIIKYLDQQNISQAYVSGMKEDLGLYGNELNFFSTYFQVGYCIMLIPSQVIMTYMRPSWWLPGLELIWGILTGLVATASNASQIYALRTFIGLCESSAWPGMMTLFMHWYTPTELAKRMGFYHSCQAVGAMMANALQTAVHQTLDGRHGLPGWRLVVKAFPRS